MKTNKILLPGMLATMMFAACTNEEYAPQQSAGNQPEQDLKERPMVGVVDLNFGSQSQTRAEMGSNFNDIVWTSTDKVGARIIDTKTGKECNAGHAEHKYTVGDNAWSNYRYDFDADNEKWTSDALMVEGNYMFYAPYNPTALDRSALSVAFPTVQEIEGLTPIKDYVKGAINGNASAVENFYSDGDYVFTVGHTFLDAKENDGTKVSPQMAHLYAYPLVTLVNDYTVGRVDKAGKPVLDESGDQIVDALPLTIDQITIESTNIVTGYTVNQPKLAEALRLSIESVNTNGDKDFDDKGECPGKEETNWATQGVKSEWFVKNASTDDILNAVRGTFDATKGEKDPNGKITINLDKPVTIPAGYAVKFNVVMPAATYAHDNFKVNVRVLAQENGETVEKKFAKNTFKYEGDGVQKDDFTYAVSKQIPVEEYNFKNKVATAKSTWGTLTTFKLSGELVDFDKEIVDPNAIVDNAGFYGWLDGVADNSTSKYEKCYDANGKEVNHPVAGRKGDFRLAEKHNVIFNADLVAAVDEYLNSVAAKVYFVSPMTVEAKGAKDNTLTIDGAKFPEFGKLTIKNGHVVLKGVKAAELVVAEGATVAIEGASNIGKVAQISGDVTLKNAKLIVDNTTEDKTLVFTGAVTLDGVTIEGGKAIFKKKATIKGGSFGDVEFQAGASLSGDISGVTATVTAGTIEAGNNTGWSTVNLHGGSMNVTNNKYQTTVNVGRAKSGNLAAANGTLTADVQGASFNAIALNTADSKFVVKQNAAIDATKLTWTAGSIENNATLAYALTVPANCTYTHGANAAVTSLINNGKVTNNGKLALTNNKEVIVGDVMTKTTIMNAAGATTGTIDNSKLGYITGTNANFQTIFVNSGAFTNDELWNNETGIEVTNSKVNTLYINGKWTVNKNLILKDPFFESVNKIVFVSEADIELGAATLDFNNKAVVISSNQDWAGFDSDVSEISGLANLTFAAASTDSKTNISELYTLKTSDINFGTQYEDAITTAINGGNAKVKLTKNMDLTDAWVLTVASDKASIIDFNGKTITLKGEAVAASAINAAGKLTLTNAKIVSESEVLNNAAVTVEAGADVTIEGDITSAGENASIKVADATAKATINRGTFVGGVSLPTLLGYTTAECISVKGGSFTNYNPFEVVAEGFQVDVYGYDKDKKKDNVLKAEASVNPCTNAVLAAHANDKGKVTYNVVPEHPATLK
ncbi:MAG: hypothetical protein UCJ13_04955 [Bacteroidaceae bacterium]|nr:hypothetical protein [Bacteroidaceae bacterium]